jgi:shikimate dehydrogenase
MTERVGLIGWPLGHSVSPAMHNAAFAALGLDWRYEALPTPPEALEERLHTLVAEGYRGVNVTVPHKGAILSVNGVRFEEDESVTEIGAANTLTVRPDGTLLATNSDWQGFADALRAQGVEVAGRRCLILGTGGSARAVAYALQRMDAGQVAFVSRDARCAHQKGRAGAISYNDLVGARQVSPLRAPDLIVNCTPVGMYPNTAASPWPADAPFPAGAVLYDLIYNPPATRLMQQARDAGARAIGGLGMLVRQGVISFEQWTGIKPPLDVMERAAQAALGT